MRGWGLVAASSLAIVAPVAAILAVAGWNDDSLRAVLRLTARTSLFLFLLVFAARPATQLVPTEATKWLLANRRYLGVSFAVSHTIHLAAIFARGGAFGASSFLVGAPIYALIFAMAVTSFDRTTAWLGRRRWKILHTTGVYAIWTFFVYTYAAKAAQSPFYFGPLAALLVVGALRPLAWWSRRRRA